MGTSSRSNRRKALRRVRRDRVPLSTTWLDSEERKQQILQQCLNAPKLEVPIVQDTENDDDVKMQDVKINKKKKKNKSRGVELMMTKDPKTEAVKKFLATLKANRKLKRMEMRKSQQEPKQKPAGVVIRKEFKKKVGDKRFNKRKYKNKPKDISDVV
eukprot:TRINITY_DN6413_c0_g3_i2.p4 TRINITY_DN6413_c0_g3~~TRINITY_DN6413_c0_g3_i2.p4  ORF type:complete len:168 (-),score=21.90 TRINITY_DN6413_c0_g3_i2:371-841(-)